MKSTVTLIKYHEKALCTLELLQKADKKADQLLNKLGLWDHSAWDAPLRLQYRWREDLQAEYLIAFKVASRIANYYNNLVKKLS